MNRNGFNFAAVKEKRREGRKECENERELKIWHLGCKEWEWKLKDGTEEQHDYNEENGMRKRSNMMIMERMGWERGATWW